MIDGVVEAAEAEEAVDRGMVVEDIENKRLNRQKDV